jgi:hypothetical protein
MSILEVHEIVFANTKFTTICKKKMSVHYFWGQLDNLYTIKRTQNIIYKHNVKLSK